MLDKSCEIFLEELASGAPVPGGGGASALCGAMGAALGSMVCNLTTGKKKYAAYEEDIQRILATAKQICLELQRLVKEDAVAFEPLSQAYGLPKSTPAEQEHRDKIMEQCLHAASAVPLQIMEQSALAVALHQELLVKGSKMVLSDVGVGTQLCRAALIGASFNVFINTKLMKDRTRALSMEAQADGLLAEWVPAADKVVADVLAGLRG